jgi:hypothetical protein
LSQVVIYLHHASRGNSKIHHNFRYFVTYCEVTAKEERVPPSEFLKGSFLPVTHLIPYYGVSTLAVYWVHTSPKPLMVIFRSLEFSYLPLHCPICPYTWCPVAGHHLLKFFSLFKTQFQSLSSLKLLHPNQSSYL